MPLGKPTEEYEDKEGEGVGKPTRRKRWKKDYGTWTVPKLGVAQAMFKNAKAHRIPERLGITWNRITRRITRDVKNDVVIEDIKPKDLKMNKETGLRNLDRCTDISVIVEFEDSVDILRRSPKVKSWADITDEANPEEPGQSSCSNSNPNKINK